MAISGVEIHAFPATVNNVSVASTPLDTTGKTLIVLSFAFAGTDPPVVADSEGNTWLARPSRFSGAAGLRFYYCSNPATNATHTFSGSATAYPSLCVLLAEGTFGADPFDVDNWAAVSGVPSTTTGSVTPSGDGALLVSGLNFGYATGPVVDSGFTHVASPYTEISRGGALAYLVQGTAAAVNPTWTWTGGPEAAATLLAFVEGEDTGGGGTSYTLEGPSSGECSEPSANFTVTLIGGTGTVRVTPSDGGSGGTFTPAYLDLTAGAPVGTFTYTAIWWGPKTIAATNDGGMADPAGVAFLAKIQLGGANVVGDTCPDLGGCPPINTADPYYQDISAAPIRADSAELLARWCQDDDGSPWPDDLTALLHPTHYGTPYCVVPESQPLVPVAYNEEYGYPEYGEAFAPIPDDLPLEGIAAGDPYPTGHPNDQHAFILVRDEATGGIKETYELYSVYQDPAAADAWTVSRLAWKYPSDHMYYDRPEGMPSTSAGGTRILPPLIKWDDVYTRKVIPHALRIMVYSLTGMHIPPARCQASGSRTRPFAGTRIRLKASYDISGFDEDVRVVLQALKTYGAIMDDGGPNWELTGTRDARWAPYALRPGLNLVKAADFEVLDYGPGYLLEAPASLSGDAGVASGLFTVTLTEPTANVGEFAPGGLSLVNCDLLDAAQDVTMAWTGTPAGGTWLVNEAPNYRIDLETGSTTGTFRYIPPPGLPDGTEITLVWIDSTLYRAPPEPTVYTIGEAPPPPPPPSGTMILNFSRPGGKVLLLTRPE